MKVSVVTWPKRNSPLFFAGLLTMAIIGCGGGKGTVTGKVTYQDKPLPGGFITFVRDAGGGYSGKIEKDGTYKVSDIPSGSVKISVRTLEPPKYPDGALSPAEIANRDKSGSKAPPSPQATYVRIPEKYGDAAKSGLTLDVKSGTQEFDIPLK